MRRHACPVILLVLAVLAGSASTSAAAVQQRRARSPESAPQSAPAQPAPGAEPLTAGQVQMLFDAYIAQQAQDALSLSETQYGRFVTSLRGLQKARNAHQQGRARILAELRRILNPQAQTTDDAQITDRIRALRDLDESAAADIRKAYDAVDETLDVRQRARFRLFEERMEQQKLQFVMRARENARALRGRGR